MMRILSVLGLILTSNGVIAQLQYPGETRIIIQKEETIKSLTRIVMMYDKTIDSLSFCDPNFKGKEQSSVSQYLNREVEENTALLPNTMNILRVVALWSFQIDRRFELLLETKQHEYVRVIWNNNSNQNQSI